MVFWEPGFGDDPSKAEPVDGVPMAVDIDDLLEKAEQFFDGPEPIDPTHIREGVVVRIINRPTFTAYKHKNFNFKVIEGIIKDVAEVPDMEEADGFEEEMTE